MKASFIIILFAILLTSCNQPDEPNFRTNPNRYSGTWEIHLSGDLTGAATFVIDEGGYSANGIPIKYFNAIEINTYVDNYLNKDGSFSSKFYFEDNYSYKPFVVRCTGGSFSGTFKDSTAGGNYNISINDNYEFTGTWSGYKYKLMKR